MIKFSSYNREFSYEYNTCLSQSRTNRRSIAMQGFTIADVGIYYVHAACPFIILRLAFP